MAAFFPNSRKKWVILCLVFPTRFKCFRKLPDGHQGQTSRDGGLAVWLLQGWQVPAPGTGAPVQDPSPRGWRDSGPQREAQEGTEACEEKPCKSLKEELDSSQTEWDSQEGFKSQRAVMGVSNQHTQLAIKISHA